MSRYGDNHRGRIAYIDRGIDWNVALPALRCSEMQDRRITPAPRREAQDLRHVTVHKTHMTPASSVVTEPTAARKRVGVDPQGKAEGKKVAVSLCSVAGSQRRYMEWKIARLLKRGDE